MKKAIATLLMLGLTVSMVSGCGSKETTSKPAAAEETTTEDTADAEDSGEEEAAETAVTWAPEKSVSIVCLSASGGGSDINTRAVIDTFKEIGIDTDFVVDYKNDGGGAVGWQYVADAKKDDYLLMCYGFGDVINQVDADMFGVDSYKAVAVVSAEQEVLLSTPQCKYEDFNAAVEAAKAGTVVTIAGSGGVDPITYQKVIAAAGLTEDQMPYVQHNSTGEAIVTMLGNHADFVVAKPSSCISYVESGELVPYVAFQSEHFAAPLDTAPTAEELGLGDIKSPMWRGFAVPKTISDEAYAYYCDIFQQLVDSPEWTAEYVDKYAASPVFLIGQEAQDYMQASEDDYRELKK